jgi:hypothetical protein
LDSDPHQPPQPKKRNRWFQGAGSQSWKRAAPGPAHADSGWIDEVKLGVLAHDIRFLGNHVEPGADINVEVLFPSPALLRVL